MPTSALVVPEASIPPADELSPTEGELLALTLHRVGLTPLVYVVFAVGLVLSTPLRSGGAWSWGLSTAVVTLTSIRLAQQRRVDPFGPRARAHRALLRALTMLCIACFSVLCSFRLLTHGVDPVAMTGLVILAGVASGGVAALAGDLLLTRSFVGFALAPPVLFGFFPPSNVPVQVPLAILLCALFYYRLAGRLHGEDLERLSRRQQLEANQKALELAKSEAEAATDAKSQFLATMSHELRTPLNGVVGMTELLLADELSSKQRDCATILKSSANALRDIIDDILDISKIESGSLRIRPRPFDLTQLLSEVAAVLSHAPRAANVEFRSRIDAVPNHWLVGDAGRLRQMLLNLGINALKFTHAGWVELVVQPVPTTEGNHVKLRFSVEDTGIGINIKDQQVIFEKFYQADSTIRRRYGGTGLGLAITRELGALMGTSVELLSRPEVGSKFWFELEFELAKAESESEKSVVAGKPFEVNVLVVDDNAVNRTVAKRMLEKLGACVTTAEDGAEACELVDQNNYDAVFMDCMMPKMDGYTATRLLRARGHYCKIIAMTANARPEDKAECLRSGMDQHLAKPLRLEDFENALSSVGENRTVRRAE